AAGARPHRLAHAARSAEREGAFRQNRVHRQCSDRSCARVGQAARRTLLEARARDGMNGTAPIMSAADRVRRSSFYAAMRIMPRVQREAMYEIYAFCRNVDDVADGGEPADRRRAELSQWRNDVMSLFDGGHPPARLAGLAAPVARFGLKRDDFLAIVDGMEMDAAEDIRAPDIAKLDLDCDREASAVVRLSVRVFGMVEAGGRSLPDYLR